MASELNALRYRVKELEAENTRLKSKMQAMTLDFSNMQQEIEKLRASETSLSIHLQRLEKAKNSAAENQNPRSESYKYIQNEIKKLAMKIREGEQDWYPDSRNELSEMQSTVSKSLQMINNSKSIEKRFNDLYKKFGLTHWYIHELKTAVTDSQSTMDSLINKKALIEEVRNYHEFFKNRIRSIDALPPAVQVLNEAKGRIGT